MIAGPVACFDAIVWFEPRTNATEVLDEFNHNIARPQVGEERAVCIRHGYQRPIGGRMWLLFQSGFSLVNGFTEPEDELENAALVEVEVLSQHCFPKNKDVAHSPEYNAQVRCLQIVGLGDIPQAFAPCEPQHWPESNREVQIWETPPFTFVRIIAQISPWFVLTKTQPPRLIVERWGDWYDPFTVCNCEWDWTKWPHHVYKNRQYSI